MTEKELQKIYYSLKIVFGDEEARKIFVKLYKHLFN